MTPESLLRHYAQRPSGGVSSHSLRSPPLGYRIHCSHRLWATQPDLERQPAVPTTAGDPHSSKAARALHRAALEANCRIDPVPFVI